MWDSLIQLSQSTFGPWLVGGDFNIISNTFEKAGGVGFDFPSMSEFNDFSLRAGLSDAGFEGNEIGMVQ